MAVLPEECPLCDACEASLAESFAADLESSSPPIWNVQALQSGTYLAGPFVMVASVVDDVPTSVDPDDLEAEIRSQLADGSAVGVRVDSGLSLRFGRTCVDVDLTESGLELGEDNFEFSHDCDA